MKTILIIASVALLSTTVHAENSAEVSKTAEIAPTTPSNIIQMESPAVSDLVLAKSEEGNSQLWEMLDTNKDGSISKTEAASSKKVISSWDKLDSNKDKKLDTEEFARIFSL